MTLKSAAFLGSTRLERALRNQPPIAQGESGHGVALLQAALITVGYKLPLSTTKKFGAPDGIFGQETRRAVVAFQVAQKLTVDGVAGRDTIRRLDSLLPAPAPPKPAELPKPAPPALPVSKDFKIGTDDPKITPDKGAGPWKSKPWEVMTAAKRDVILNLLAPAYVIIGDDAVKHMAHYFENTGDPLTIDLEGMVAEVPSAKLRFETDVQRIKDYVSELPPGVYDITSTRAVNGYNRQAESSNWYFAVGGYSVWPKGRATVTGTGPGHDCKLELEYKFYDRYNWDGGKYVKIAGFVITDEAMGEFHRQGMAKEYDEVGSLHRTLQWKAP